MVPLLHLSFGQSVCLSVHVAHLHKSSPTQVETGSLCARCATLYSSPLIITSNPLNPCLPLSSTIYFHQGLSLGLLSLYLSRSPSHPQWALLLGCHVLKHLFICFFIPLILSYCPSWRPVASGTRPPQEFCSLCSRHESASRDNDEELRHAGDPASISLITPAKSS